jgi:hypothetical protein
LLPLVHTMKTLEPLPGNPPLHLPTTAMLVVWLLRFWRFQVTVPAKAIKPRRTTAPCLNRLTDSS